MYGEPLVHPQPETYWGNVNPIGPRSCYDEAKRFSEALTMAYHRTHGVDVRIVRIFNTYGPRMRPDDGRVVTNFVVQALQGKPLTIYGDGKQTRSFCFVDDEVRGFLALLDGPLTGPVNIGNPNEFTMLELAEQVLSLTGSRLRARVRAVADRRPDPAQARHHDRARPAGLVADHRPRRRSRPDDRLAATGVVNVFAATRSAVGSHDGAGRDVSTRGASSLVHGSYGWLCGTQLADSTNHGDV